MVTGQGSKTTNHWWPPEGSLAASCLHHPVASHKARASPIQGVEEQTPFLDGRCFKALLQRLWTQRGAELRDHFCPQTITAKEERGQNSGLLAPVRSSKWHDCVQ